MDFIRSHRYPFVMKKVFNWSELHLSEVTSYKIHTLIVRWICKVPYFQRIKSSICKKRKSIHMYSRVHKSSDSFFSKILEKPSIVQKKMIPHIKGLHFSMRWSKKKIQNGRLKNSKWPPQKKLIFQLRQFSIFFHENFMDWSLG